MRRVEIISNITAISVLPSKLYQGRSFISASEEHLVLSICLTLTLIRKGLGCLARYRLPHSVSILSISDLPL